MSLVVTGVAYPALVTGVARVIFPGASEGSLIRDDKGTVIGSSLIGQGFSYPAYFQPRPSAAGNGYDAGASSGSNLGPTSQKLRNRARAEAKKLVDANPGAPGPVPSELVKSFPILLVLASAFYSGTAAHAQSPAARPGWKVEGWVEGDYSASSADRSNLPLGFNLRADDAHFHQAWVGLEYPLIRESPSRVGLRFDAYVGSDHFFTRARGLFSKQSSEIGFDPLQFYVEGHTRGLGRGTDLRIGRFSSPIGAEYNAGPANMLPSHSYSFIYDPFTHTGAYAQTTLDERWTLLNGIVTGSDIFVDPAMRLTYLNGLRYIDDKDSKKSAQLFTILGPGRFDVEHGFNHINVIDLVATYPLGSRLLLTGHTVYGWEDAVPGLGDVDWFGLVPYLTWTFSDSLAATLRLELFDDDEGNRTGFAGEYRTATLGFTWKPEKWLAVRPELRFDDHSGAAPFEGKDHLTTGTINAYIRW